MTGCVLFDPPQRYEDKFAAVSASGKLSLYESTRFTVYSHGGKVEPLESEGESGSEGGSEAGSEEGGDEGGSEGGETVGSVVLSEVRSRASVRSRACARAPA